MSFDLVVTIPRRPDPLRPAWEREFATCGFLVEIHPGFELAAWGGGFRPIRVTKASDELVGVRIDSAVIAGFEVDFEADAAYLRTAMGRKTMEFALQCVGAATLAILSGGR